MPKNIKAPVLPSWDFDRTGAKMDFIEISKQLEEQELKNKNKEFTPFKPIKKEHYELPQCKLPKLNGNNRQEYAKVYSFILLKQRARYSEGATIMPISTTSKRLTCITGSAMNSSNLIKFMVKIGLITVEEAQYQFKAFNTCDNKSRTYCYYVENEKKIVRFCNDNNVAAVQIRNYEERECQEQASFVTIYKDVSTPTFDESRVRFNSKLHLTKPTNWSVSQFEVYLKQILYKNYPTLKHYMQVADYINNTFYHDDLERQIVFKPTITWANGNKYVRKIGIRATNKLVSAKTNNITGLEDDSVLMKQDVLDEYGLNLGYDVKSSVPRITYFMNTGIWKNNGDFYHDIYRAFGGSDAAFTPEIRKYVKKNHMRGYFDSASTIGPHMRRFLHSQDKSIDEVMKRFKQAVEVAEGGTTMDSEVFYHESCVYMDVLKELLERGFKVWEVYDSWYAKKDNVSQEEYDRTVEEILQEKTDRYYRQTQNGKNDVESSPFVTTYKDVSTPTFDTASLASLALSDDDVSSPPPINIQLAPPISTFSIEECCLAS